MNVPAYIALCRPIQWLKNLMLFFPAFLGGTFFRPGSFHVGAVSFISFGMASSSSYVLNDILDRFNDANHPTKKYRPLPSGHVSVAAAYFLCLLLLSAGAVLAFSVSLSFGLFVLVYVAVQLSYSLRLKEVAILDIFCIAAGFLLRLEAGGLVFHVDVSSWLFLSVFLLALFLSTGKRLGEIEILGERAGEHRRCLTSYPPGFLEGVMYMTGGSVMVTYTMFVMSRHTLVYTVPLCCFGLFRYVYRIKSGLGGDPTEALTKDLPLFTTSALWGLMIWYGYYRQ